MLVFAVGVAACGADEEARLTPETTAQPTATPLPTPRLKPTARPSPTRATTPTAAPSREYVVQPGDTLSRQEKREHWNCDAYLSLAPENMEEGTDAAAYRRAVSVANVIVMPLDEPSIAYWHGLDDAARSERILPFANFLRSRYPCAQVLVFFVADNLVVGRAIWPYAAASPEITICHEALPLEEIEPELLGYLPVDRCLQ